MDEVIKLMTRLQLHTQCTDLLSNNNIKNNKNCISSESEKVFFSFFEHLNDDGDGDERYHLRKFSLKTFVSGIFQEKIPFRVDNP
jgi:hypothetical protein